MLGCAKNILVNEGPFAFYKVCLYHWTLLVLLSALTFSHRGRSRHYLESVCASPSSLLPSSLRKDILLGAT